MTIQFIHLTVVDQLEQFRNRHIKNISKKKVIKENADRKKVAQMLSDSNLSKRGENDSRVGAGKRLLDRKTPMK